MTAFINPPRKIPLNMKKSGITSEELAALQDSKLVPEVKTFTETRKLAL